MNAPPPAKSSRSRVPAADLVLSTLNRDGSRRWLKPRPSHGRHYARRRAVAAFLILLFTLVPFLEVRGGAVLLLDVAHRRFTVLGTTFLASDAPLIGVLVVLVFLVIFLLTALFGRVWCGYACPQTVYLEFVYRPLERWIDRLHRAALARPGAAEERATASALPIALRALRMVAWGAVSFVLANTFLAYFVGVGVLGQWMRQSPLEHPGPFLVMGVTTLLMLVDFAFFREQMCTLACPYGRFQSALFDRATPVIGYDRRRGEPRAKLRREEARAVGAPPATGDCIDCNACVATCPTGIDIRNGLQMECVACAQCIDACDGIMARVGRAPGLIRYAADEDAAPADATPTSGAIPARRTILRPRVLVYLLLIASLATLLAVALSRRAPVDAVFLRTRATPYRVTADGRIECPLVLHLTNRTSEPRRLAIGVSLEDAARGPVERIELMGGAPSIDLAAFGTEAVERTVVLPAAAFHAGRTTVQLVLDLSSGERIVLERTLIGPLGDVAGDRENGDHTEPAEPDGRGDREHGEGGGR